MGGKGWGVFWFFLVGCFGVGGGGGVWGGWCFWFWGFGGGGGGGGGFFWGVFFWGVQGEFGANSTEIDTLVILT